MLYELKIYLPTGFIRLLEEISLSNLNYLESNLKNAIWDESKLTARGGIDFRLPVEDNQIKDIASQLRSLIDKSKNRNKIKHNKTHCKLMQKLDIWEKDTIDMAKIDQERLKKSNPYMKENSEREQIIRKSLFA